MDDTAILESTINNSQINLDDTVILELKNDDKLLLNLEETDILESSTNDCKNNYNLKLIPIYNACNQSVNSITTSLKTTVVSCENNITLELIPIDEACHQNANSMTTNIKAKNVDRNEIWKKHLSFPRIEKTNSRKKHEMIYAITLSQYRELEMKKMQLEIEEK